MIKRAYVELRERALYLQRLAFYTITEEQAAQSEYFHLTGSRSQDIDCVLTVDEVDIENARRALDCDVTYRETIERTGIKRDIPRQAVFEIFQEEHDPPLNSLLSEGYV